jgi:hypothetical protein
MVVNVDMFLVMVVAVLMLDARGVKMKVFVGLVPVAGAQTPDKIGDSETYKKPSCEVAPEGFEKFEFADRNSHRDTDKTDYNRAADVAYTAQESYDHSFEAGPFSGPGNHYKGEVMVGAEQSVDAANRGGSNYQGLRCNFHNRTFSYKQGCDTA